MHGCIEKHNAMTCLSEKACYLIIEYMKDPDTYRQQEGLKLTAEERKRNRFPLRFFIIAILSYILFFTAMWFIFTPKIKANFESHAYIERYNRYRAKESAMYPTGKKVMLIGKDGLTEVKRTLPNLGRDSLHLQLEALLMPLSESEESQKLYSAIPEKTKLLGVSQKGKVILVELSDDFLKAEDIEAASAQIRKTLSIAEDNLRISIKVNDRII